MIVNAKVLKKDQETYVISWDGAKEVTIFLLAGPDKSDKREELLKSQSRVVEVTVSQYLRPYFLLVSDKDEVVVATRVVPLEGANNFRDLGGYLTKDGRSVRWGRLFRSDHLHRLTSNDFKVLEELGVRTVIDYRREDEYEVQQNQSWSTLQHTFHVIPEAERALLAARAASTQEKVQHLINREVDKSVEFDDSGLTMMEQARDFVRLENNIAAFRQVIDIVLDAENIPIDQHCRGGKDRTGYGVAIILYLLGVEKETIIEDFMLTKFLREARNKRRMSEYANETDDQNVLSYLYSMLDTREEYLTASFDEMVKVSGSVEDYFSKVLKVTPAEIEKLKELYLMPN